MKDIDVNMDVDHLRDKTCALLDSLCPFVEKVPILKSLDISYFGTQDLKLQELKFDLVSILLEGEILLRALQQVFLLVENLVIKDEVEKDSDQETYVLKESLLKIELIEQQTADNFGIVCQASTFVKDNKKEKDALGDNDGEASECHLDHFDVADNIDYDKLITNCMKTSRGGVLGLEDMNYLCETCSKFFPSKLSLHHHKKYFHKEEKFDIDSGDFKNKGDFQCKLCLRYFLSLEKLDEHKTEKHSCNEKIMRICQICGIFSPDITSHIKIHVGEGTNLYQCDICPNSKFKSQKLLDNHIRNIHKKGKIICSICGIQVSNIQEHKKVVHQKERRFSCTKCDFVCFRKQKLQIHTRLVHENIHFTCPNCGKLVKHMYHHLKHAHKNEPHLYDQFKEKCGVFQNHGDTTIKCDEETKKKQGRFELPCDQCKQTFASKNNLNIHKKLHHKDILSDSENL